MYIHLMNAEPIRPSLDQQFREDGFRPLPLALVSDLNAIAEQGCVHCGRLGTTEAVPYWNESIRLRCVCHECLGEWEA